MFIARELRRQRERLRDLDAAALDFPGLRPRLTGLVTVETGGGDPARPEGSSFRNSACW